MTDERVFGGVIRTKPGWMNKSFRGGPVSRRVLDYGRKEQPLEARLAKATTAAGRASRCDLLLRNFGQRDDPEQPQEPPRGRSRAAA